MTFEAAAGIQYSLMEFNSLDGWVDDDHAAALAVFLNTCQDMDDPDGAAFHTRAKDSPDPRAFFERFFRPVMVHNGSDGFFTGYFEPELRGSRHQTTDYRYPVYAMPNEARVSRPWLSRRDILETDAMIGRNLEIAWVDDPVELFFLQIQGSGRIRMPNGESIRLGYAGANGHEYRSIGAELIRRGIYEPHQVSAQVIKNWIRCNPADGKALLCHNPSYVFFREVSEVKPHLGPLGAMNRSITPMRSVAVDPSYVPLGAPVWLEKDGKNPLRRLMIAQDTGSAIKGPQRADVFFGTGDEAGRAAGQLRDPGRMMVLMPNQQASVFARENAP